MKYLGEEMPPFNSYELVKTMLKFYKKEHEAFPAEYATKLTDVEANYVFDRLKAHYKFRQILVFRGTRQHGNCSSWRVRLPHSPSIGILAHEVAHAIQYTKKAQGKMKEQKFHTKKHQKIMARIISVFSPKLADWKYYLINRQTKEKQASENRLTKEKEKKAFASSPEGKLEKINGKISVWSKKLKLANTKLKKLNRQKKLWQKKLEGGKSMLWNPIHQSLADGETAKAAQKTGAEGMDTKLLPNGELPPSATNPIDPKVLERQGSESVRPGGVAPNNIRETGVSEPIANDSQKKVI
jgi:hypothetical protein